MFCNNCGVELSEGTKFCSKCGAVQTPVTIQPDPTPTPEPTYHQQTPEPAYQQQPPVATYQQTTPDPAAAYMQPAPTAKPKKRKWWLGLLILLVLIVGSIWTLNFLNVISLDAYLSNVVGIKMKPYYPIPTENMKFVGEYEGSDFIIQLDFEKDVEIDGDTYFVRTRNIEYNDYTQPSFEFLIYDKKGNLYRVLSTGDPGIAYDKNTDYELVDQQDVVMPATMKLGKTLKFELDLNKTEYTLTGFKDVKVDGETYHNVAVLEVIFYYDGVETAKEITYHAKNIGMVKIQTFYYEADEWVEELELELER